MKTLYLERSVSTGRGGNWVEELDLDGVERIVVGTGPGSFAGIRSAIAFAQGYALGRPCEVLGLPSPCAVAAQINLYNRVRPYCISNSSLAVIGDARCGKLWVALFDGFSLIRDVFQVNSSEILGSVPKGDGEGSPRTSPVEGVIPKDCSIVTVDEARIGEKLKAAFGERYLGGQTPTAEGLKAFAEANPSVLKPEPLPIYLNPAVRG